MQSSIEITKQLKSNWEEIKKSIRIESGITDISYRTWIDPLTVYGVKDNTVMILIPQDNPVALSYISKNYIDFFKVSISEFYSKRFRVIQLQQVKLNEQICCYYLLQMYRIYI